MRWRLDGHWGRLEGRGLGRHPSSPALQTACYSTVTLPQPAPLNFRHLYPKPKPTPQLANELLFLNEDESSA
jgi:hypothetical protein